MFLAHQTGTNLGQHGMDITEFIGLLHGFQGRLIQALTALAHLPKGHGPVTLIHVPKK